MLRVCHPQLLQGRQHHLLLPRYSHVLIHHRSQVVHCRYRCCYCSCSCCCFIYLIPHRAQVVHCRYRCCYCSCSCCCFIIIIITVFVRRKLLIKSTLSAQQTKAKRTHTHTHTHLKTRTHTRHEAYSGGSGR